MLGQRRERCVVGVAAITAIEDVIGGEDKRSHAGLSQRAYRDDRSGGIDRSRLGRMALAVGEPGRAPAITHAS